MATTVAELGIEEQAVLNDEVNVKEFYAELEKRATTPPTEADSSEERLDIELYNLVGENDESMQLRFRNAFAQSQWKKIRVEVVEHESRYEGDRITLFRAVFDGLGRNTIVETFSLDSFDEQDPPALSIPCLPPNLGDVLQLEQHAFSNTRKRE